MDTKYFCLNQQSMPCWSIKEAAEACYKNGISWIGLNRNKVKETGLKETVKILNENNLKVSTLSVGAQFPAASITEREDRINDNFRAIEEVAELKANALILTGGSLNGCDIISARKMINDGISKIIPYAEQLDVNLGIEPLHPVFTADRSVINTLEQANEIRDLLPSPNLGVVIDVYHVWWEPKLYEQIDKAKGSIFAFHVNDWITPMIEPFTSRGMMGSGYIDLKKIRKAITNTGYDGPIEVEIFNRDMWERPYEDVLEEMLKTFKEYV